MGFALSKSRGLVTVPKRGLGSVALRKVQSQAQQQTQQQTQQPVQENSRRESQFENLQRVGFGTWQDGQGNKIAPRKKLAI